MKNRGFTLIEILLVCVLIASLVAIVSPRLGGTSRNLQFEQSVQHLAEAIRFARQEAVRRGLRISIQFQQEGNRYQLEIQDRLASSKEKTTTFEDPFLDREWSLPVGFRVEEILGDQVARVPSQLVFSPSGVMEPTILSIGEEDGEGEFESFITLGAWYDEVTVTKALANGEGDDPSSEQEDRPFGN